MADLFIYSKEVNGFSTTLSCIWLGNLFTINVSVCYTHNLTIIVQRNICQVSLQVYHIYIYIYRDHLGAIWALSKVFQSKSTNSLGKKTGSSRGAVSIFSNRSRHAGKVGEGVQCRELYISSSFGLPDHLGVFHEEVAVIKVTVDLLLRSAASFRVLNIHSDSSVAILVLSSLTAR